MKILLTAINAKYIHSSLSVRYLYKNCTDLDCDMKILEVSINNHLIDIANQIFDEQPDILAISCYIWNISMVKRLIFDLKQILPEVHVCNQRNAPVLPYGIFTHVVKLTAVN